jgi:hypothetical protein
MAAGERIDERPRGAGVIRAVPRAMELPEGVLRAPPRSRGGCRPPHGAARRSLDPLVALITEDKAAPSPPTCRTQKAGKPALLVAPRCWTGPGPGRGSGRRDSTPIRVLGASKGSRICRSVIACFPGHPWRGPSLTARGP